MASGKHAANVKSFDDFKHNRNRKKRQNFNDDDDFEESVQTNAVNNDELEVHNNILNSNNSYYDEDDDEDEEDDDEYWDDEREINYKKIAIILGIIVVIAVLGVFIYKNVTAKKTDKVESTQSEVQETLPAKVGEYTVLGKIIIKDIGVEQYILNSAEDDALEKGISKIYGPSLNNYGNVCLAGHNFDNMFKKLSELEVGDTFIIVDKKMEETTYKITKIYSVEPDELECLTQDEEKIEITLITCESGSTKRLIVKAEEQESQSSNTTTNNVNTEKNSNENE
jgi:LPXTG-site transpeptidase (sortase) family protein